MWTGGVINVIGVRRWFKSRIRISIESGGDDRYDSLVELVVKTHSTTYPVPFKNDERRFSIVTDCAEDHDMGLWRFSDAYFFLSRTSLCLMKGFLHALQ